MNPSPILARVLVVAGGLLGRVGPLAAQNPGFIDRTAEAGLDAEPVAAVGPLALLIEMGSGVGVIDYDQDGWPDLFVPTGGPEPDRLYRNQGDGTFVDVAPALGLDAVHAAMGVAVGDIDRDGWPDLYVTSFGDPLAPSPGRHRLYRNLAGQGFEECARERGVARTSPRIADAMGACFGDMDLDGDLDLAVAGWRNGSEGNRLFENQGDGTFVDRTGSHLAPAPGVRGFNPCFADMDGDRYPELLLSADFGTSRYWINRADGSFLDQTLASGTGLDTNGMGSLVADLDQDGRLDWYVSSVFDPASPVGLVGDGNKLYRNLGHHAFEELATATASLDGGFGWGCLAEDFDLDGDLDIVATNGFRQLGYLGEATRYFRHDAPGHYVECAAALGLDHRDSGRGVVTLDADRDGDLDLVISSHGAPLRYFENQARTQGARQSQSSYLILEFGSDPAIPVAPEGLGVKVEVRTGGRTLRRTRIAGSHHLSCDEPLIHFGLGTARRCDEIRIHWPDGRIDRRINVAADRRILIDPR